MGSRRANEQCITWLKSMAADQNSLDGINAELCLNLIQEQKDRLERLGAQFQQIKASRDQLMKEKEMDFPMTIDFSRLTPEQKQYLKDNGIEIFEF